MDPLLAGTVAEQYRACAWLDGGRWLLGPDGKPLRRYKPGVDPLEMSDDIEALLNGRTLPSARKRSLNDF